METLQRIRAKTRQRAGTGLGVAGVPLQAEFARGLYRLGFFVTGACREKFWGKLIGYSSPT